LLESKEKRRWREQYEEMMEQDIEAVVDFEDWGYRSYDDFADTLP
jgi:hypothetical protein